MKLRFNLGDKVSFEKSKTIYTVTGVYLKQWNQGRHCNGRYDYRITTDAGTNTYKTDEELLAVRLVKAFAYVKPDSQIIWVSKELEKYSENSLKRVKELDIQKMVIESDMEWFKDEKNTEC